MTFENHYMTHRRGIPVIRAAEALLFFKPRLPGTWRVTSLALLACVTALHCQAEPEKPNFILIVADDLGYGDLGSYGNTLIRTPVLDRLASEGVRLKEFYSAAPTCSPARAGLLTGRHPLRTGITRVFIPKEKWGMPNSELTLAEHLRTAGYATACIGKWHLGGRKLYRPDRQGFDRFFGVFYSNNMNLIPWLKWPRFQLYDQDQVVESPPRTALLTQRYTNQAIRFLKEEHERPMFLYLSYTMPHIPLAASAEFTGRSSQGIYADVVEELDTNIGYIIASLVELGISENSYVFVTSDNGPWKGDGKTQGGSTGKLRGSKGTTWEGGVRVPFLAWAPGRLPANQVRQGTATLLDLFPTISRLASLPLPEDREYDGMDINPLLQGRNPMIERDLFFSDRLLIHAARSGNWKLHLYGREVRPNGVTKKRFQYNPPLLFHLGRDEAESNNIAANHPEIIQQITARISKFQKNIEPVMTLPSYSRSVISGLLTHAPDNPSKVPR